MKICLTVLMGLPGSGKTTFAQTLTTGFKTYDGKRFNFIHICYDELLPLITVEEFEQGEIKWKDLRTDVLNQLELLLTSVKNNCLESCPGNFRTQLDLTSPDTALVIIIDDNMYLRSMRYALFQIAKQYNASFCQVYLKCSVELANERNLSRHSEEVVPFHVISQMNRKIEAPKSTNKWEKYSLIGEACSDNYELYVEYINMLNVALDNPECLETEDELTDKGKDLLICDQSVSHQCDIALRQIISEKIKQYIAKNGSAKGLKDYSAKLTLRKGKIVSEVRSGAIQIPLNVLTEDRVNSAAEKKYLKLFMEEIFDN